MYMEDKWLMFQKFLITENSQIPLSEFLINGILLVILAFILEKTYTICARSLSNRKIFAANFIMIAFTTMTIISIVKSSLALSLGLVGALSIVRFRSAIKEPEELAYLFFAIAVGLGLGANQRYVVITAFAFIVGLKWLRWLLTRKSEKQNLLFTVYTNEPKLLSLSAITQTVKQNFVASELKRFDSTASFNEISFLVEIKNNKTLENCTSEFQKIDKNVKISFLDHKSY